SCSSSASISSSRASSDIPATDLPNRPRPSASSTTSSLKGPLACALLRGGAGGSPGGSPPAPYRSEQARSDENFFSCVEGMRLHSLLPYTDLVTLPQAAGTFKGGYGFAPMLAYADQTGEALAGQLRPGNAGANDATDQIAVAEQAVAQIPAAHIETIEILLRVDSAGASHELIDWCREGQIEFSVGYDLTETVRAAILQIPEHDWVCSLDQDGHARPNGQVCEITEHL